MFQYNLTYEQLVEIKKILTQYFAMSAKKEIDRLWEENDWTNEMMKSWADEHFRK
jgi:hypothetical protein